jgi:hypothetical protein
MNPSRRSRFWAEVAVAAGSATLAVLTLAWRDWIEGMFGVDFDHHSGSLEWAIVVGLLLVAVVFGLRAPSELRRRNKPRLGRSAASHGSS